jgi:hypothetical protein
VLTRFAAETVPSVVAALIEAIESSADSRASAHLVARIPVVDAGLGERLVDATALLGLLERHRGRSTAALDAGARNGATP